MRIRASQFDQSAAKITSLAISVVLLSATTLVGGEDVVVPVPTENEAGSEIADTKDVPLSIDPDDLSAFIDGTMAAFMESKHIAGAAVSVVVGGKTVFSRGYGYADIDKRITVSSKETMFCLASTTKLFTWTSVMQLVEQGRLDLDTDINEHLGNVQVPPTYPQPITLKHLLTHTSGFEDKFVGHLSHIPIDATLESVLAKEMPERVCPPGIHVSYSNYGAALAARIVERVSGVSWEDYVTQHILDPLSMSHTLVHQPPPEERPEAMSNGYRFAAGLYQRQPFDYYALAPAGSASSTADDMARFMAAHLQDGLFGSTAILRPETARRMREDLFSNHPDVDSMAHGFLVSQRGNLRIVRHGGNYPYFGTLLDLFPEHGVGVFLAYNTGADVDCREVFRTAFINRYFSPQSNVSSDRAEETPIRPDLEGVYASLRCDCTGIGSSHGQKDTGDCLVGYTTR